MSQFTLLRLLVIPLVLMISSIQSSTQPVITIIGTGYVGLVTGAGLAELGNKIICVDIDEAKIALLNDKQIPIYEPGLQELVMRNVEQDRLIFTTDIANALDEADIIMIAVGTPTGSDGSADLTAFWAVIKTITHHFNRYKVICTKSTVPVGTASILQKHLIDQGVSGDLFDIVSNPEFLREGTAVYDFLNPDRIVFGVSSSRAEEMLRKIYFPLIKNGVPTIVTNPTTSETIKYAANSFLAVKLSFINELANLCDVIHADITSVAQGIGSDKRIGSQFLYPGPGYGGSCLPKDTQAFLYSANIYSSPLKIIKAATEVNDTQQLVPFNKLARLLGGSVNGKVVAVLGLAFKAGTDDIRYSPAIPVIEKLLAEGAIVKTYDPAAMNNMMRLFPDITYCSSTQETYHDADAVVIMTEWPEFKILDLMEMQSSMRGNVLVDSRNLFNLEILKKSGMTFETIGRGNSQNTKRLFFMDSPEGII